MSHLGDKINVILDFMVHPECLSHSQDPLTPTYPIAFFGISSTSQGELSREQSDAGWDGKREERSKDGEGRGNRGQEKEEGRKEREKAEGEERMARCLSW